MNDNIKIGADINAGDGGYTIGTQEKYDEFAKGRNQSLGKMRIEDLMYRAGLTAQGCWDEMDDYDRKAIEKFAELIVRECIDIAQDRANFPGFPPNDVNDIIDEIREHFGVEE